VKFWTISARGGCPPRRRDVDESVNLDTIDCGSTSSGAAKREVRHVELYDKLEKLIAVGPCY
jgi:hypothetical protein